MAGWMFPIRDADGRIVSFGGRALAPGPQPKYMNGPQIDVFDKGNTLFALHAAAATIRKEKRSVVVEGYVDVSDRPPGGLPERRRDPGYLDH